jgi:uncharacterized protein (DUF1697 family)
VSNVAMQPFRAAMEDLGFWDVSSLGMSGNLLFNAKEDEAGELERRIGRRFGTEAFVRTRSDVSRVVTGIPFEGGSSVLFLRRPPAAARRRAFHLLEFEPPHPVLRGRTIYFVYPARRVGRRSSFDFEKALDVMGTARSARVVTEILHRMSGHPR